MLAVTMLILALAVSFDGFGTGVSYGIRKIRIPALSIIIIAICSATIMFLSMQLGNVLFHWLSQRAANGLGAFILIAVGFWAITRPGYNRQAMMMRLRNRKNCFIWNCAGSGW